MRIAFLVCCCFASLAFANDSDVSIQANKITTESVLQRYTIEQMHQAIVLFRAVQDRALGLPPELPKSKGSPILLTCAPDVEKVQKMFPELRALWDAKIEKESERMLGNLVKPEFRAPLLKSLRKEARTCQVDCHCGAYATLLEKMDDRLPADMKPLLVEFQAKASKLTAEQNWICAQKAKWFCSSSPLQKYLLQEDTEPEFSSDSPSSSAK